LVEPKITNPNSAFSKYGPKGLRVPTKNKALPSPQIFIRIVNTIEAICSMTKDEEFLFTLPVKGVGENRPLISVFDAIQFRFEMFGTVNYVIGIVVDVILKTDEVVIKLPSPMFQTWVSYRDSSVCIWNYPFLPYWRFLLASFGLDTIKVRMDD